MSDIAEIYKALKEHNKEKKQQNKKSSIALLDKIKVQYTTNNDGIHLIVQSGRGIIDFWPTTGKFIARRTKYTGRGVNNMIKYMIDFK